MRERPVRAVTFDFWNTVMWERPGSLREERLGYWFDSLPAESGASVNPERLERAHDTAHAEYEASWRAGRQFQVPDAVALVAGELGDVVPATAQTTIADGFSVGGLRAEVRPTDGVGECLSRLRQAGVGLGIVCDIGLTPSPVVRSLLERHDLLRFFDHTAFSDEVGSYKPSRTIFERALTGLGEIPASACAHVGDRLRTDVAGARAMGMESVRYRGVFDDDTRQGPEADHVIDLLAELPPLLGIPDAAH